MNEWNYIEIHIPAVLDVQEDADMSHGKRLQKIEKNEIEHMEISIGIMRTNLPKILSNMK